MSKRFSGFLCLMLVACLLGAASPAEAAKFRIAAHRALHGSWEVVAHKLGYFKEAGLDYTITHFKQGKLIRDAVISDNMDVGTVGTAAFVTSLAKGAKLTAVAVNSEICGTQRIVVPVKSKVKSVKDIKGMTLTVRKGEGVDFSFRTYVMPKYGLKESDLNWLSLYTTERVAALVAGNAQVAIIGDPQAEIAEQKGLIRPLEDFCAYDKIRMLQVGNPRTLKSHPELYEKYFRAWIRVHELAKKDPEKYTKAYTDALKEVGEKADYSIILPIVKRLRSQPEINKEVRDYVQDIAQKIQKIGWIKQVPDFQAIKALDDSIYRKAKAQLAR